MFYKNRIKYLGDTMNLKSIFGKNIKYYRFQLKYSQEQLAETLNMSRSFISHLESPNVNKGISIDTLFLISQKFNLEIRDFFEGYEEFYHI